MITYKELIEKKQPTLSVTISEPKDAPKAAAALRKNKVKFSDESQQLFTFKKEKDWDAAMSILDDLDIDYSFDG